MICGRANRLLSAYIDDELSGRDKIAVREHLRHCGACCSDYESLLSTKRLLAGLPDSQPRAEFEGELLRRLHLAAETGRPYAPPVWSRLWDAATRPLARRALALAAGAAFAAVAVSLVRPEGPEQVGVRAANLSVPWAPPAAPAPRLGDMLFLHDEGAPFASAEPASFEPHVILDGSALNVEPAFGAGMTSLGR